MHTLPKMKYFLSSQLSPPLSLPKSPSSQRSYLSHLRTVSERRPFRKNPIFPVPKTALPSSRTYVSSRTGCGHLHAADDGTKVAPFGEIHVIMGPMFAGKTTALLRRVQLEGSNGRKYAMIKSNKDNRYGLDSVVTHDGVKMPCWALSNLSSFRVMIGEKAYEELDVIGIDEAQFFEDLHNFCQNAADHDGKTIFIAGLDGDYLRRPFGSVTSIIPLADSVTKLTAQCKVCGERAFFTLRKSSDTKTEVIGGADVYMPVCRRHYVDGQVAVETARLVIQSQKNQHLKEATIPSC